MSIAEKNRRKGTYRLSLANSTFRGWIDKESLKGDCKGSLSQVRGGEIKVLDDLEAKRIKYMLQKGQEDET